MATFKPVLGYESLYQVGDDGQVIRSCSGPATWEGRALKQSTAKTGYKVVGLTKNGKTRIFTVHTLVLEAFVGKKPDGMECLHADGSRDNNRVENLSWGTRMENIRDKIKHGRSGNKITSSIVSEIKERIAKGVDMGASIAKMYGVSESTICDIKAGRYWSHV